MAKRNESRLGDFFYSRRERGFSGLPILSVTLNNGLIYRDELDRKTETNLTDEDHLFVKKGDIAYNMMRMWQGANGLAKHDGIVSPAYIVLAPLNSIDSVFASYLFKIPRMEYLFWAFSYGLTKDRLRLYFKDFAKIPVVLPLLEDQKRIGKIISTWDRAIAILDKLIENCGKQKKALMQELLTGKKRFKKFESKWCYLMLSNLVSITMGSSPKSEAYNRDGNGLPLIQGNADIKERKTFPRVFTSQVTKKCIVGDIMLSVRAPVGSVAKAVHDACIGRGVAALSVKDIADKEFVYQMLLNFEPKWNKFSQGSTFGAVNSREIKILRFFVPASKEEQEKIGSTFSVIDRQKSNFVAQKKSLLLQKKALLQQLLTGKRRVVTDNPIPQTCSDLCEVTG
ncbi:MAG: restriction endonuclease subunit S [Desulfobacteraceae bacterium]|nr:restriction endonuclease subunit S [Desulfobacteraceae bacterium]